MRLTSTDDEIILASAKAEDRTLISCDHDFVQLLFESGDHRPSLLPTRDLETSRSAELAKLILTALSAELEKLLTAGAIAVLTLDRVRIRTLPLRGKGHQSG